MSAARVRLAAVSLALAVLAAGCATPQHPAFIKGQELLAQGQWEQGIAQLELAAREGERNYQYRAAAIDARTLAANELVRQGGLMRDAGRFAEAEALYRRVLRMQPEEARAIAGLQQTAAERKRGALLQEAELALAKGDAALAERNARTVLLEVPRHARAAALLKRIEERKPRLGVASAALGAALKRPITLQFRDANLKMIFDVISREAGVSFVLDRDIRADLRASIFVKNTPIEEAVESLLVTNALARKVMSDTNVLIYPNTPQKAREYQDLVIRNFYLQSAEAKQMLTLLRTILKSQNIFIDEKRNLLVMRDTPEAVQLAERLIAAHDQAEPEVMLEVEVLEVGRALSSTLGVKFPDAVSLGVADPITLQALNALNSSGVNVTGLASVAAINLKKLYSNVNLLANPRIRVRNKEKAKIHVGDRVPVISTAVSATTAISTQTVNYLDVGIKLEVEPQVLDNDVMIKVALEVSSLGQQVTVQNAIAYQIGTRNASTTLTLKDGETQILAGLINDNERETTNKLPGIGELPVLGRLFSNKANQTEKTEIVLSITPRIIHRLERPSSDLAEYWSGPETNLRTAVTPAPAGPPQQPAPSPALQPGGVFPGASPRPAPVQPAPQPGAETPAPATPIGTFGPTPGVLQPLSSVPGVTITPSPQAAPAPEAAPAAAVPAASQPATATISPPAVPSTAAPAAPTATPTPAPAPAVTPAPAPTTPPAPGQFPDIIFQPPPGVGQ